MTNLIYTNTVEKVISRCGSVMRVQRFINRKNRRVYYRPTDENGDHITPNLFTNYYRARTACCNYNQLSNYGGF